MAKESLTIEMSPAMREALQIQTKERVDYYTLLGLHREVNDEKIIDTAILNVSKLLRKWQSSPTHGADAVKLLTIVHRAGKILKEPGRRSAYRQELERAERGEGMDSREEFRTLVRAAMADNSLDITARKELMRFAADHNIGQGEAQQVVTQVREELSAAKAAETVKPPQEDSMWEFRIAEEGEEGFLLMLAGMEQGSGDLADVSLPALMAQAAKQNIPPDRAAALLGEFQKTRFKKMVKRVAGGDGVVSDAQVRLLLPKAAAYGLDQRQAYDIISDYTLSARSTEDALKMLAYAQTFSDEEINTIVENKPVVQKSSSWSNLVPDWLRNLVLIGAASAALIFLVVWLKGNFQNSVGKNPAVTVQNTPTPQTANPPAQPVGNAPAGPSGATTPAPTTTPEIPLEEKPDPLNGMLTFNPEQPGDPPAFEMQITEVTCAQYQEYLKATLETPPPGWSDTPDQMAKPVANISYPKAMAYCQWLAERQHWPKESVTLPSHGEFLRILRYRTTKGYPTRPNFWSKAQLGSGQGPAAVKQNPFDKLFTGAGQIYDLVGNLAEWGREGRGSEQELLGGDFMQTAPDFNPMVQRWVAPATTSPTIGFRVVHLLGK